MRVVRLQIVLYVFVLWSFLLFLSALDAQQVAEDGLDPEVANNVVSETHSHCCSRNVVVRLGVAHFSKSRSVLDGYEHNQEGSRAKVNRKLSHNCLRHIREPCGNLQCNRIPSQEQILVHPVEHQNRKETDENS